ncbi:TTF-type domain-containing protein [Citrus sinensis]|nr:TTF-type domain-containing protein [Citrus sinensis]
MVKFKFEFSLYIVRACSIETTNAIIRDVDDALVYVLIDESHKNGSVIKSFIGLKHVTGTTSISLKEALDQQGYDGANNMQGKFNSLRTLIMNKNECAYYIHCFAHQLQLAIVAIAKKHDQVNSFFNVVANVVTVVGASFVEALENDDLLSGQGQNQEITLKCFSDTRWGSHYSTLLRIIFLFPHMISLLEIVAKDMSNSSEQRFQANYLVKFMQSFDFVLSLYLMNSLLSETSSFCLKHDINVPNMNDAFLPWGRSQRKAREISNMHYFRVELFFAVLDLQLQELNTHFNEVNMELLLCLACLCPNDTFVAFDKDKLLMALKTQLQTYIMDMRSSTEFAGLKGIGDLAKRMAETKKDKITFSVMKFVKNELRNWMGDEWMNDNLIISIEKDVFNSIDNESIAQCFQNMKSHREQL